MENHKSQSHRTVDFQDGKWSIPSVRSGWIRIESKYSVLPLRQSEYCSLVGRVVKIGPEVKELVVGDWVIALASPSPSIKLAADKCLKLKVVNDVSETIAFYALVLALIPVIRHAQLEIGEQVLVLSSDLVGYLLAELAWLSGSGSCVVFDTNQTTSVDSSIPQNAHGLRWLSGLSDLEAIVPANSVDLLIDVSGDPAQFQSNLSRVRDGGRVLLVGNYQPGQFDFNVYPDLHRRSLIFLNHQLPTSLVTTDRTGGYRTPPISGPLDFVQHLLQTECLHPLTLPTMRLHRPDGDSLAQLLQTTECSTLLIEW